MIEADDAIAILDRFAAHRIGTRAEEKDDLIAFLFQASKIIGDMLPGRGGPVDYAKVESIRIFQKGENDVV